MLSMSLEVNWKFPCNYPHFVKNSPFREFFSGSHRNGPGRRQDTTAAHGPLAVHRTLHPSSSIALDELNIITSPQSTHL
ncbi:hypothetical protein HOLleu_18386 [Holothuria leucospilota]|uniref:Uncharacterized protein n=1 Tax=Holothuria leucospilota TaxID=206669 RepID=A0A9Q1C2S5_HOLLE|nr:hypothetical protein HOLleu_18386 [Holothuria leucospilota]